MGEWWDGFSTGVSVGGITVLLAVVLKLWLWLREDSEQKEKDRQPAPMPDPPRRVKNRTMHD